LPVRQLSYIVLRRKHDRNLMNWTWIKSKSFLAPTALVILFIVGHLIAFQSGPTKYPSVIRTMVQWDGRLYLSIARDGYQRFPCENDPTNICGNGGWFPLYPLVGGLIASVGLDHRYTMIGLSWALLWLSLLVLYRLLRLHFSSHISLSALVVLLLYPGAFYYLTTFPYATYLCLSVLLFYLLDQGHWRWIWLPTSLLTITYPSGAVIGLPLLVYLVQHRRELSPRARWHLITALASIPIAILIYFGYYWYRFNDFWLYVRIQSQSYYAHEPAFPLVTIWRSLAELPLIHPVNFTLVFALVSSTIFYRRRLLGVWQLYALGILLFTPTMGTADCYYRHIIVAWPLMVMIAMNLEDRWRRYLLPLYVLVAVYVNFWILLPAYRAGQLM